MEAIGQLTGGIAHDFNNRLMIITGGLDMLEQATEQGRREKLGGAMRHAADRVGMLTSQLLAFSRRMDLAPEPVDLRRLIDRMNVLVAGVLRGDIRVEVEIEPTLWPILADRGQLELVLLNLAVNARDAMPSGGVLTLSARNEYSDGQHDAVASGDFVRIEVRDTGTGIAPAIIDRVFDPFFTTKPVGKGTGLGAQLSLWICDAIRRKGRCPERARPRDHLHSASPAGGGVEASERAHPPSAARGRVMAGNLKALLVEDNDEVAELAAEMLATLGFAVDRVASADEALAKLDGDARDVNLVFSDVVMPGGMNGVDLARELRRRRPNLPVLLTSGYSDVIRKAAPTEGLSLLEKPYGLETLEKAVRECVGC